MAINSHIYMKCPIYALKRAIYDLIYMISENLTLFIYMTRAIYATIYMHKIIYIRALSYIYDGF